MYLDYYEQKSGHGERIKLDYTSIMQILAAAMDIIGVNDDTVEMLLGDYRLKLDKKVFESMDISGIDDLRTMLNALANAVDSGKSALADVKTAWGACPKRRRRVGVDKQPRTHNRLAQLGNGKTQDRNRHVLEQRR